MRFAHFWVETSLFSMTSQAFGKFSGEEEALFAGCLMRFARYWVKKHNFFEDVSRVSQAE